MDVLHCVFDYLPELLEPLVVANASHRVPLHQNIALREELNGLGRREGGREGGREGEKVRREGD